jgi:hypothetical protein
MSNLPKNKNGKRGITVRRNIDTTPHQEEQKNDYTSGWFEGTGLWVALKPNTPGAPTLRKVEPLGSIDQLRKGSMTYRHMPCQLSEALSALPKMLEG